MRLKIRASDIKNWFQYRCDRQLIYAALPRDQRDAIPVDVVQDVDVRAEEGVAFEEQVLRALVTREGGSAVLRPTGTARFLSPELVQAFLLGQRPERFAYQPLLSETAALRSDLQLPDDVFILDGVPDLIEWVEAEGERRLQIVDIKHTRLPTQYHRAQVAFYALMLRGHFAASGQKQPPIHHQANLWHIPKESEKIWEAEAGKFTLRGYEEMIRDFFRRQIISISQTIVIPGRDESLFHLYFKCEQCKWIRHCIKSISDEQPREAWDISAVPGMSHQSKRALRDMGLRTLRNLAEAPSVGGWTWALRTRGSLLKSRAEALLWQQWRRLSDHHTWLMPPHIDVPIFVVVDSDPVAGHVVSIGCLIGGSWAREPVVEVIPQANQELPALKRVLRAILEALSELDQHNANLSDEDGLRAHIFVYEPAEANDLRNALAGYLDDSEIRTSLLHLVRLFPPEEIRAPEPEYRGAHHLPASALRSVIEQLYVLPAKVSYDLARVSRALATATPPLEAPYSPGPPFARHFSARLSIEVARKLEENIPQTRADVLARLRAMESLCRWILDDNASSEQSFLRLRKPPFRFQAQFHPLDAIDLDVLLAQELLQSRAERLARLVELARPAGERRERLNCYANLRIRNIHRNGSGANIEFEVPHESRQAEITPGSMGLILTDDDPDLRMDPILWPQCAVELLRFDSSHPSYLRVRVRKQAWTSATMQRLIRGTPQDGWFIDQAHVDVNTGRMETFLRFLSKRPS